MTHSLKALIETQLRQSRKDPPRFRVSQSGDECVRRMYYQATGAPREEDSVEGLAKMGLGTAMDEWVLRAGDGVRIQVPVTINAGGFTLTGKSDVVFGDPAELVSDLKCVGVGSKKLLQALSGEYVNRRWLGGTWAQTEHGPTEKHAAQVNMYAYGLGAPRWSVCYVNVDTGEIREHFGDTDEYKAEEDLGSFEEGNYHRIIGRPPPRPFTDIEEENGTIKIARKRFPCGWCAFNKTCWEVDQ